MLIFATLLSLLGVARLVGIVYGHRQLARGLSRSAVPASRPASYPSVTVIRPMRGLDVGARENILALLDTVYPGPLEILFVFDSESDPGFPLVRELIQQRPRQAPDRIDVLFAGTPPPGRTGKLNAMLLGAREAKGELLAFGDSDTRPEPQLLQQLVDALLADPKAGASFAPIVAAADVPTAGDIGYGLLVNAWYGPSVELAAGSDNQLPFIMGQLMVFRREALNAIGGLGTQFTRPNWLRGILAWTAWIALILSVAIGSPAATLLCMAAICTVASSQVSLQRSFGGPRVPARYLWVPAILPLIAGAVALSTRFYRRVDWRGRNYNLDRSARLDQPTSSLLENSAKPK